MILCPREEWEFNLYLKDWFVYTDSVKKITHGSNQIITNIWSDACNKKLHCQCIEISLVLKMKQSTSK